MMASLAGQSNAANQCISQRVANVRRLRIQPVQCMSQPENKGHIDSDGFGAQLRKFREDRPTQPSPKQPAEQELNDIGQRLGGKLVLGNDLSEDTWRAMDKKVNKYPGYRTFTAIGSGGAEFRASMVQAVERVLGQGSVHLECVSERPSSKGQYLSVKVGPVRVHNPDQVIQIFAEMKKEPRLKWYM